MDVTAESLESLRTRQSVKWRAYPDDVLPLFVAEMDYPLAPAIKASMLDLIEANDLGYAMAPGAAGEAFAGFAARRWNWAVDPANVRTTTDVSVAIVESLRRVIAPGDRVVIMPPIYPPFFELVPEAGGIVQEVPLLDDGSTWSIDLDGIERALAAGARAILLCNPHNPLGLVHSPSDLEALAELAAAHEAFVVSDEIHGPLVHVPADFTPFLSVSDAAREHGIAVTSASKAFNIAGTKCALMVAASDRSLAHLDAMPDEVTFRTSILGLHANIAAFTAADDWLDAVIVELGESQNRLRSLLAEELPDVSFRPPRASYLAWLDLRALGWGDDPSAVALERARVALNPGPEFGSQGRGFARLNFACSEDVLARAIRRLAAAR
jgi:cystathionine beta-lyase